MNLSRASLARVVLPGGLLAGILLMSARLAVRLVEVQGMSMEPTLSHGDLVLATRWWPRRWLRRGMIVLLSNVRLAAGARSGLLIKRVANIPGDLVMVRVEDLPDERLWNREEPSSELKLGEDELFVLSDYWCGIDSRVWGPVPVESVSGIILVRLRPGIKVRAL